MRTTLRWARFFATAALAAGFSLPAGSCGFGHHRSFQGTLQACNHASSSFVIKEVDVTPFDGGFTDVFNVFLDAGECTSIDLFPGTYLVDAFYEDDVSETQTVDVFDDTTAIVTFTH